jgi:hypothetical protein
MADIAVIQTGADMFTVNVTEGDSTTVHRVRVSSVDHRRLAPDVEPALLVEESFRFLLDRESKEAILRRFDLPVIGRYYPEYETEIRSRLGVD